MARYGNDISQTHVCREPVHNEPVVSLSKIQPGLCVSGSKDKVFSLIILTYHLLYKPGKKQHLENYSISLLHS